MDDDLGVAWLVKRVVVSRILRGKPAPDVNDVDNALVEGTNAGRLVWGSMVPDIIGKIVGRGPLEKEIAETYSHRLGEDLDAVSSKALKEGYTASLSKGIDKSLSWARVAEAWGLDGAQMRSFIGSMKEDAYSGDIIPKRSAKQLEVMLNTRADRIAENESYAIGQLAKQTHWIKMQQTGEIGPDVRKKWHTAADERVCPVCGPIDGQVVALTATFGTGVFAPPVHPNCFPAGTKVSGPAVRAAMRRWYEGDMVRIVTASGRELSVTPEHPILTDAGWITAGQINDGSNLVCDLNLERVFASDPDDHLTPSLIEDVVASAAESAQMSSASVPVTSKDLDRDRFNSEVYVIDPDGLLRSRFEILDPLSDQKFVGAGDGSALVGERALRLLLDSMSATTGGVVRRFGETSALLRSGLGHSLVHGLGAVTCSDPVLSQNSGDGLSTDSFLFGKGLDALSSVVSLDQVISVSREPFSGHVYNLQTSGEWYIANGIVTHNCRCWTEIIESTVVTKRDYKRDSEGQFARQNTLMSIPGAHPFGRDTFGNPRPTQDDIQRMKKETAPLKGGKGGYDIVGGSTSGSMPFGTGISLVPTRDEKYYQMHYRDWYDKKIDHNLFSPDEYYARTWSTGTPYKQPKEEDIFSDEERVERAQTLKDIEGRWAENVARANKENRAPDMPSEEDLRNYWPWDEGWSGSQGKWEGKYREFHPSANRPPVNEHRMYKDLQQWQAEIDETTKKLPDYEGLRTDGKKIIYTALPREYDDENGLNPNNYPLRHVKPGDPAWEKFASDYATEEGMMTGFREDPHLPDLIDREDRARKGAELYRVSQRTKTLSDVYNSGSERNSHRLPINPKKYQQKAKLRRLRSDIESRDASIREGLIEVNKSAVTTDEYKRDADGQFATVNTLVPKLEHTGPSLPKRQYTPLPEQRLTQSQMRQIKAVSAGKVITGFEEEDPVIELQKIAAEIVLPYYRNTQMYYTQQDPHPAVTEKVAEVSQIIYDSKVRAGKTPKYKLKPKSVKMEVLTPAKPQTVEPDLETVFSMPQTVTSPVTVKSKVEVRGFAPEDVLFVVLPASAQEKIEEGGLINFSTLPPLKAYDPRLASMEELNLEDVGNDVRGVRTGQVLLVSGATWHPSKDKDGTGTISGSYNVADYRFIQDDQSYVLSGKNGMEVFVLVPESRDQSTQNAEVNPDDVNEGRKRYVPKDDSARDEYGREERDPLAGKVLAGESGRSFKNEAREREWLKQQGLTRNAVDVPGYVDFSSTQTPFKKDNILKRLPMTRKVT